MPVIRHRQHHGVNVVTRHHFAVIMIGRAVFVLIMVVDCVHRGLQMFLVQVARGDHLAIVLVKEGLGVARSLHAPTDDTQRDAVGRPGTPGQTGGTAGENQRQSERGAGGGNETAPADVPGGYYFRVD